MKEDGASDPNPESQLWDYLGCSMRFLGFINEYLGCVSARHEEVLILGLSWASWKGFIGFIPLFLEKFHDSTKAYICVCLCVSEKHNSEW